MTRRYNALFSILDGRARFYQWDLDRKVVVEDESINQVHFCNRTDECSLVCDVYYLNGKRVANVPNVLLQTDWRINVYGYDKNYTKYSNMFEVVRRSKPADYVYTETEVKSFDDLAERIDQIEENGVSDAKIADAVNEYLEENPITVDLTGLATESYVDEKFNSIEVPDVDLTGYATEDFVKTEISKAQLSGGDVEVDLSNYYTKSEVDKKISTIELTPGPEGKPGKDGVDGKDGEDYVLTDEDKAEIAGMVEVSGGETDLTDYYTKTEVDGLIPDVSGYQTADDVQAAITAALGEIGVAEEGAY